MVNPKPMSKTELVAAIGDRIDDRRAAADAVGALIDIVTKTIAAGREVRITGFLSLKPDLQPERTRRNPSTGKPFTQPAGWVVKVKPGSDLKTAAASRKP
jgi:DNA-binding protein HU-beta